MPTPKLSIVLTAYNPRYLRQAVESILNQSFGDFEFIIIDDSVAVETSQILAEYAGQDSRIVLVRNEHNLGQAPSLNKGLAIARGNYIARQDDDDISDLDRFNQQVVYLDSHPAVGLLGTRIDMVNLRGESIDDKGFFSPQLNSDSVQEQLYINCCLCHGSVMLRRQLLEMVGNYDVNLAPAEDYDLWLRLATVTQVARLDARLYQLRVHPESVSGQQNHRQAQHAAEALEKAIFRRFGPTPPPERLLPLAQYYLVAAVSNYRMGEVNATNHCLTLALLYGPDLFASLDEFIPLPSTAEGFVFAESIFSTLPATHQYNQVREKLRARLHMRQVFEALGTGDISKIDTHLWPGLRHDPAWLLNRGVRSVVTKSLLRGVRARLAGNQRRSEGKHEH
jgi:glycosyltransferase involved in cell wall biosynthesis